MADAYQLKAILSASDNISPVLKSVGVAAKNARKYLADVASSATALTGKLGMPMTMISGLAAGFSTAAIKNAVVGFTQIGEAVYKGSLRAGMSVEEYQKMKYVAEQAGVSVEALEGSMGKLNAQNAKAAAGQNKNLASLYARLGISMRDGNGAIRSAVDLLPELADAFDKNKNPAVQARIGMALFGKQWAQIIPLLAEGSEELLKSSKRYETLRGMGLSKKAAIEAKELGDQFKDLDWALKGFQNTIAKQLVPVISPLVDDVIQWAAANRKVIASGVKEFVSDLVEGIKAVDWSGVINGARKFVGSLDSLIDMIGGTRNALITFAVVMNAQTLIAVGGLISAVSRAGMAFLAMAARAYFASNASLLSMLRIGAVALFTAGPIGVLGAAFAWLGGIAAGAGGLISGAMGAVTLAIRGIGAALIANPLGVIIGLATAAYLIYKNWDTLKNWFSSFFDWIGNKFKSLVGWTLDLARSVGGFFGGDSSARAASSSGSSLRSEERSSLVMPKQSAEVGGKITFDFQNAPPGMRMVDQQTTGGPTFDVNMGYRSLATGMP